ncbi:phosphoesterase PA-phosphatase related protein [Gloeocapsa sp. PCC 7428]|uniref:vanadium-dependent haloperoxidase n=1 Tax=Gloeocapsa sp. PCC 7428 TaxID=1173026 RepID=UPI0002A61343|nr:vanadium-dependent haloperoxidase [Gloeocapsa sp. PCC 7428]AFZ31140.1 phosphoesterase PA-phosphatase related protein [Gloeocapsa sp. PCC 7428]
MNNEKMKGDIIIAWNNIYLEAVRRLGGAPGPLSRIGAMMHIAMFDAINILCGSPYAQYVKCEIKPDKDADPIMSAAYAARKVLRETITELIQQTIKKQGGVPSPFAAYQVNTGFDAKSFLDDCMKPFDRVMGEAHLDPSQKFGEAVADAILTERKDDGSQDQQNSPMLCNGSSNRDTVPRCFGYQAGDWRETGSGSAVTPLWGKVRSMGKWEKIDGFLPTTALDIKKFNNYENLLKSPDYAGQFDEVKRLGEAHSQERTREETEIAFFWANDLDGTYKPPGQLYAITQIVAKQEDTVQDLLKTARLFALVGIAMADAAIVAWYVKYLFPNEECPIRLWRPESAIHEADRDYNRNTVLDPNWQPLSAMVDGTRFSPAFPAYISGHATFGAAHATMMRLFYGRDSIAFTATTEDPHALRDENGIKLTRRFTSFTEAARENGRSRVYLGVHYQWDAEGGFESGCKVAEYAFNKLLLKQAEHYPAATNEPVTA